MLKILTYFR